MFIRAFLALSCLVASPLLAAAPAPAPSSDPQEGVGPEIVITATRVPGSALGNVPPLLEMDGSALRDLGASTVSEIIAVLGSQTQGNNEGPPIILINGKRVADWREVARFSPDAVARVQILPEEVASLYGYLPTQRVMNLILKPNYRAVTAEAMLGSSTHVWRDEQAYDLDYGRTSQRGWTTLGLSATRASAMREADRGIRQQSPLSDGRTRWLLPESEGLTLTAGINRTLDNALGLALVVRHERNDSRSARGADGAGGTAMLMRANRTTQMTAGMDGNFGTWIWTSTAKLTQARTSSDSRRALVQNISQSRQNNAEIAVLANRPIMQKGRVSLSAGFEAQQLVGRNSGALAQTAMEVARHSLSGRMSVDVPLIGRNSINAYAGARDISDFGTVQDWGAGLSLRPVDGLNVQISTAYAQNAPDLLQLQGPFELTPAVWIYDPLVGRTVPVDVISGGNPALRRSSQRDYKLGFSYVPPAAPMVNMRVDYLNAHGRDVLRYPGRLSPAMLQAFPDRFQRDAQGQLLRLDERALNLDASQRQSLRWGVNIMVPMGKARDAMRDYAGGAPRSGGAGGGAGGGGGGAGGGGYGLMRMMRGADSQSGYWQLGVYHSWRLSDRVRLAPGQPWLDLLAGDSLSPNGGNARHSIDLEGGWSYAGLGFRVDGSYVGARKISDTPILRDQLYYQDRLTLNLRLFLNFDGRPQWVAQAPWLKGTRLRLLVRNLTDSAPVVRDGEEREPLAYQSALLEPRGRYVELSVRKQF